MNANTSKDGNPDRSVHRRGMLASSSDLKYTSPFLLLFLSEVNLLLGQKKPGLMPWTTLYRDTTPQE